VPRRLVLPALVVGCVLVAACSPMPSGQTARDGTSPEAAPTAPGSTLTSDPDQPTSWGPTEGEVEQAREAVAAMSDEELAGQVIVGRYDGTDPAVPARMVRDLHLAGVCVTSDNVLDEAQVAATTAAVAKAHAADGREWPPVVGVDQEGGVVAHLRGVATDFPPFADAGPAVAQGADGEQVVTEAARATALELRGLGFTWVFAPVADVTIGEADPTIGSRSPSGDPALAARAVAAAVTGYDEAGLVSTTKHFPGHGSVTEDSHEVLPVLGSSLEELRSRDLRPFEAAVGAGAPAVMVAHLDVPALQPGVPSSQSPKVYGFLREDLGFEGVAITDSLGMGAALSRPYPAIRSLRAGADLLLMPVDPAQTHQLVVEGIRDGSLSRDRVEEAATRVVAAQLWQQRVADDVRIPADVADLAGRAAADLAAAG
jgi:beta-N-acetylhexosaminidase